MRETGSFNRSACERLTTAIIAQAADDYRRCLLADSKIPSSMQDDCERFFRSEWFKVLTNIDGEWLMKRLRNECDEDGKDGWS